MQAFICLIALVSAVVMPVLVCAQEISTSASDALGSIPSKAALPAGTPIMVMLSEELSTKTSMTGDRFKISVPEDVIHDGLVFIPKGAVGYGEVTSSSDRSGFGNGGILSIAVRALTVNGQSVLLDGRYREEGKQRNTAAVTAMFFAGIASGLVKGNSSIIPEGRLLRARLGEDIVSPAVAQTPLVTISTPPPQPTSIAAPASVAINPVSARPAAAPLRSTN